VQITKAEVTPVDLKLRQPARFAGLPEIHQVTALFVRVETRDGRNAWGCGVANLDLTGENPRDALLACHNCADLVPDLHPTNLEFSLAQLAPVVKTSPAAACAFDLAFYDLLGLATGLPLYRLFGGFRNRIQTSVTVPISTEEETVAIACARAQAGFRMLKIKGGIDPEMDVRRVHAIHQALPQHILRLDADGGYTVRQALDVTRALQGELEMLEQPTPPADLDGLRQVTKLSPVPILADQSMKGPASALELAARKVSNGLSVKAATCGGIHCARQIDTIARAAGISTMIGCLVEPALLIAAGLTLALSSPNVRYADLDGNLDLLNDPTIPGFRLEEGWLVASEVPGMGCTVEL
jgi:L-alanine-DL-glutamate epimerase-like enolase superfamily enzyme